MSFLCKSTTRLALYQLLWILRLRQVPISLHLRSVTAPSLHFSGNCFCQTLSPAILAEGAIALSVTLSGGALFAS